MTHVLPYPLDSGARIRTFHLLRSLAGAFEIDVLCLVGEEAPTGLQRQFVDMLGEMGGIGRVEFFRRSRPLGSARFLTDQLWALARQQVYTVPLFSSPAMRRRLVELLNGTDYDLIHADSLDLSAYLPIFMPRRTVVNHHDIQSVQLQRRSTLERGLLRRAYMRHQAALMQKEERMWAPQVALNVVVSKVDRDELLHISPRCRSVVVPNGVDTDFFRPASGPQEGLVFVGGVDWMPNRDAMDFFGARVLPILHELGVVAPVRWVGKASQRQRQAAAAYGIEATGHVNDIRPYVRAAACVVVPLRTGTGTRIKILEAWAMGKAVVSTSIGCEGLQAIDGQNILIRDDPEAFARAVSLVLSDSPARERLGREGRASAEHYYRWEQSGDILQECYQRLIGSRSVRTDRGSP